MSNGLTEYRDRLAQRGLTFVDFTAGILTLDYNVDQDPVARQRSIAGDELAPFAIEAMNGLAGAEDMFPGVRRVFVRFGLDI